MRPSILIFLSCAFLLYWHFGVDFGGQRLLPTVKPFLYQVTNPPYEPLQSSASLQPDPEDRKEVKLQDDFMQWFRAEAEKIGRVNPDPSGTLSRLKQKASTLTHHQMMQLKRMALEHDSKGDERFLAVYLLGLADNKQAASHLRELALTKIPAVTNDRQHSDEVLLRAQAIESLVQKLSIEDSRRLLRDVLSQTSDPLLARHARYWLNRLG